MIKINGNTLEEADQHAMNMISNELSSSIESQFTIQPTELSNGKIEENT